MYHVAKYPSDRCIKVLQDNFYIDNLVVNGTDLEEMNNLYRICNQRMSEGGIILRSWSTNNSDLNDFINLDDNLTVHGCEEKILGYKLDTK